MMSRGYYGIALYRPKNFVNVGTLLRSGYVLGASFFSTIEHRYTPQASDTYNSYKHIPLNHYETFDYFKLQLPHSCLLVGVEMGEEHELLEEFEHPERAVYLFGAEDDGLPLEILNKCHLRVKLRGSKSLNLAVAGSIVIYHRGIKQ